jgi:hypothetical protein
MASAEPRTNDPKRKIKNATGISEPAISTLPVFDT